VQVHGHASRTVLYHRPVLKPFLILVTLAATLAMTVSAAPASAKTPCWQEVISDWYVDGRVDGIYPIPCYQQAIQKLPDDVRSYADAEAEIRRAMLDRLRHKDQPTPKGKAKKAAPIVFSDHSGEPPKGLVSRLIDKIGPSNADSVPLPLLVLAGIAFLLLAAAAASFAARRIQARRVVPAPAPAEGPRDRS
jgi:hypothetical protein